MRTINDQAGRHRPYFIVGALGVSNHTDYELQNQKCTFPSSYGTGQSIILERSVIACILYLVNGDPVMP